MLAGLLRRAVPVHPRTLRLSGRCLATQYHPIQHGQINEDAFAIHVLKYISPWHDISVYPDLSDRTIVNMVTEITKGTAAKLEINTGEFGNPIRQDRNKDGSPRSFAYGDLPWNYGAVPQTWEDPDVEEADVSGCRGDGDPLDIIELGSSALAPGTVLPVRVLGVLALIDEGECDWKLIAIRTDLPADDPAASWRDVADVPADKVQQLVTWYSEYKVAEGKGRNSFAFQGQAKGAQYAEEVVARGHAHWQQLRRQPRRGFV